MRKLGGALCLFAGAMAVSLAATQDMDNIPGAEQPASADDDPGIGSHSAETQAPLLFSGGYETDPGGRPVVLIAGALGVSPEVFREAFSGVRPARGGETPKPEQVRKNKAALLRVLAKYGVTNERLDEVSDYYRYNPRRGERGPPRRRKATHASRRARLRASSLPTEGQATARHHASASRECPVSPPGPG